MAKKHENALFTLVTREIAKAIKADKRKSAKEDERHAKRLGEISGETEEAMKRIRASYRLTEEEYSRVLEAAREVVEGKAP